MTVTTATAAAEAVPHPPRVMGLADLVMFYVVTGISLRWIATAAAAGPQSIVIWIGAFLCFFLPLAMSVMELSSRYPEEGGLYIWTREAFGDFAGYITGWSYWASNLPYFASVFYFAASNALYVGGSRWTGLASSAPFFIWFSLIALTLVTVLNLVGLKVGKWLHNLGALGMWAPALIVIVMGLVAWARYGSATHFTVRSFAPSTHLKDMVFWASLAFAFSGCEAASFMSGEIKDARRTIPRALVMAGAVVTLCYILGTFAVLLALPQGQVSNLAGLMEALTMTAQKLGWTWLVPLAALLITVGNLGAAGGFLAACARIPFVVGIDKRLPPLVAKLHPTWGTPYVALIIQSLLAAAFVLLGQVGTNVKGAYDVLVSMGIITVFLPFLLLFAAMIKLQGRPARPDVVRVPGGRPVATLLACLGFTATLAAIGLALVPSPDEAHKALAVAKVIGLTVLMLGVGWATFAMGSERRAAR
ncbi:MAG: APC family permease [Caulobacteraceae bacterium]|nr:APC family permease [Caulobacteraceae bacterium]